MFAQRRAGLTARHFKKCISTSTSEREQTAKHISRFTEIIGEMKVRRDEQFREKIAILDKTKPFVAMNKNTTFTQLHKQIGLGDLLLTKKGPVVVLKMPEKGSNELLVADTANTQFMTLASVEARLVNVVRSTHLVPELIKMAPDGTIPTVFHERAAQSLRDLYRKAMNESADIYKTTQTVVKLLQKDIPFTLSFWDFARIVNHYYKNLDELINLVKIEYPLMNPAVSNNLELSTIYAVRLVLDHYLVANKVRLELKHQRPAVLVIFPKAVQERNIGVLTGDIRQKLMDSGPPQEFKEYLKDYAAGNLSTTNPQAESVAIEIIRRDSEFAEETVDSDVAIAYANNVSMISKEGPFMDRYLYHWLLKPTNEPLLPDPSFDALESRRSTFDEPVYCIDSATAHEVDDGISIEVKGDKIILGVHIANPTSSFQNPKEFVESIYPRPLTAYLPTRAITMLPREYDCFGLKEGKTRRSLSVFTTYKRNSKGRLVRQKIKVAPLWLKNIRQLTYHEVESMLEKKGDGNTIPLQQLYKFSNDLLRQRKLMGAFRTSFDEPVAVRVDGDSEQIEVEHGNDTPMATQLVTESMIQANSAVASYMDTQNLPTIYRCQDLYFSEKEDDQAFLNARTNGDGEIGLEWLECLQKAHLSLSRSWHSALGVREYLQFTSPLRRGMDVIVHSQLQHHLLGNESPLYSGMELGTMLPWLQTASEVGSAAMQAAKRYWILRTMMQQGISQAEGVVIRVNLDNSRVVRLTKWGVNGTSETDLVVDNKPHMFRISELDAFKNRLCLKQL